MSSQLCESFLLYMWIYWKPPYDRHVCNDILRITWEELLGNDISKSSLFGVYKYTS